MYHICFCSSTLLFLLLWNFIGVIHCFVHTFDFMVSLLLFSFLDCLDRLGQPNYMPTEQDILRTRVKTTGIVEVQFIFKKLNFRYTLH